MKKKTRNIILIILGILACLFLIGKYNFNNDKQTLLKIKTLAANGDVLGAINEMEQNPSFTNIPINIAYKRWKKDFDSRFITKDEVLENTIGNKIIFDISTIYREYWREELLKGNPKDKTDTVLYKKLTDYLISNNLTSLSRDSLSKSIRNDSELKRIIENQGFNVDFKFRNGFQELYIWDKQTIKNYEVILPKDTIETKVVFIEQYQIYGYDNYATFGSSQVGGWAIKESATLFCNRQRYDLNSENFEVSYLKHESLHFTDLNKYPNLSSADLEYRAKTIELMYCTEETIYDRILDFLNGANNLDRSYSHPYANYILIGNLSKLLFNSEFESEYDKWKKLSVEEINNAAISLYNMSEKRLQKDRNVSDII